MKMGTVVTLITIHSCPFSVFLHNGLSGVNERKKPHPQRLVGQLELQGYREVGVLQVHSQIILCNH